MSAPEVVVGAGLVKKVSRLQESHLSKMLGTQCAEEVCSHRAEGTVSCIWWRQRVDVKDRYGHAAQRQIQEQLGSRLITVGFGLVG